jgi:pimeloyl-ACP methyl ester carboxylesterase
VTTIRPSIARAGDTRTPPSTPPAARLLAQGLPFDVRSSTKPRAAGSRAFVLIHGVGTSHRYMSRLHVELSADADVYSIDLPGFGGVPKPDTVPDIEAMAGALAVLFDQLHIEQAVVIGHSMGVQWAVQLGIIRPDLVGALALIGPVSDEAHRTLTYQALMLARDVLREPVIANAVVFADYLRCGSRWYLQQARFMVRYPLEQRVRELSMPVLVIRGGSDPIATTDWCRRLVHQRSDARLVAVPRHRHVVQFTAPRAVASAIRSFLAPGHDDPTPPRTHTAGLSLASEG